MESKNLKKFIYEWFIPVFLVNLIIHIRSYFINKKFFFADNEMIYFLNLFVILLIFRILFYSIKSSIQIFLKETFKGKILLLLLLITLILMKLK